jgi:hypothetical protein
MKQCAQITIFLDTSSDAFYASGQTIYELQLVSVLLQATKAVRAGKKVRRLFDLSGNVCGTVAAEYESSDPVDRNQY